MTQGHLSISSKFVLAQGGVGMPGRSIQNGCDHGDIVFAFDWA